MLYEKLLNYIKIAFTWKMLELKKEDDTEVGKSWWGGLFCARFETQKNVLLSHISIHQRVWRLTLMTKYFEVP